MITMTFSDINHVSLIHFTRSHQPFISNLVINAVLCDPWVSRYYNAILISKQLFHFSWCQKQHQNRVTNIWCHSDAESRYEKGTPSISYVILMLNVMSEGCHSEAICCMRMVSEEIGRHSHTKFSLRMILTLFLRRMLSDYSDFKVNSFFTYKRIQY